MGGGGAGSCKFLVNHFLVSPPLPHLSYFFLTRKIKDKKNEEKKNVK